MNLIDEQQLTPLFAKIKLRDQAAFKEFYQLVSPSLFALLMKMLKEQTAAEDALQEVFIKIWNKAEQHHSQKGSIMVWAYSITRYHALDKLRQQRYFQQFEEDNTPDLQTDCLPAYADASNLQYCIEQLDIESRQSIFLAYYQGYSHQELSDYLKTPLGTVKSWIRRSLISLRACLNNV